ncbi:MAG TPA: POTRA domain-containing protein, partial [Nevskiaceae bacterium]|nr:POTRA domain-containing protein [Nevskiaceae bacterium]
APAPDPEPPRVIREIAYEGNDITQPVTMKRELVVKPGDLAEPGKVEESRQAIQDLGLFREVKVRQEPLDDGTVRLVFTVREKWYVLPIPRLEINSDGDTALGMQLRWNNLWGLDHRMDLDAIRHDYKRDDRDSSNNYALDYEIPFLGESRNALHFNVSHSDQNSNTDDGIDYRERKQSASVGMARALTPGPASQGWKVGGGVAWQEQRTSGDGAPDDWGQAIGPVASIRYRNQHDYIYSKTGAEFETSAGFSVDGMGSDYDSIFHESLYTQEWRVGRTDHQTLRLKGYLAGYYEGPASREHDVYEFGGSEFLRGYKREKIDGNFAYLGAIDYLRPMHWKWLRFLATLEAGSALDQVDHARGKYLYASFGLGVSVKVTWLVNVEFEAGFAYPLVDRDGDGVRFFGKSI